MSAKTPQDSIVVGPIDPCSPHERTSVDRSIIGFKTEAEIANVRSDRCPPV